MQAAKYQDSDALEFLRLNVYQQVRAEIGLLNGN